MKVPEHTAAKMLRECARKALARLQHPHADVTTIARQMQQTSRLVLTPPCSRLTPQKGHR